MLFYTLLCSSCAVISSAIMCCICHKILSFINFVMCIYVSLFTFKNIDDTRPCKEHKESK